MRLSACAGQNGKFTAIANKLFNSVATSRKDDDRELMVGELTARGSRVLMEQFLRNRFQF